MSNQDCRKFSPNIFNKSKCSNCFRLKEDHSASAIELNKASRKISKCGYLFVAPDWDFSNPINRTKRWQRRWFVLYDDGELTYSVDDHPETIPQACIDMNRVMEVARADEVTGNPFSVAITAPERVHFVKGTCKEESTWWLEVLQIFPRSSVKSGRAKRNATFPGGVATTYSTVQYTAPATAAIETPPVKCDTTTPPSAADTASPTPDKDMINKTMPAAISISATNENGNSGGHAAKAERTNGTTDNGLLTISGGIASPKSPTLNSLDTSSRSIGSPISPDTTNGKLMEPLTSTPVNDVAGKFKRIKAKSGEGGTSRAYRSLRSNTCENLTAITQEHSRTTRFRYNHQATASDPVIEPTKLDEAAMLSPRSPAAGGFFRGGEFRASTNSSLLTRSDTTTSILSRSESNSSLLRRETSSSLFRSDSPSGGSSSSGLTKNDITNYILNNTDSVTTDTTLPSPLFRTESRSSIRSSDTSATVMRSSQSSPKPNPDYGSTPPTSLGSDKGPLSTTSTNSNNNNVSKTSSHSKISTTTSPHSTSELPVRGVPDGCGLDSPTSSPSNTSSKLSTSTIPIPSALDLLNLKKGWLMKFGITKDWQKHWFVLQGSALMYFRDPVAENEGVLDGIIDLGLVQKVEERDVQRNYGFVVSTLDEREYTLSAVTHGIRNNWINALKTASNLNIMPESDTLKPRRELPSILDQDIKLTRRNTASSITTTAASGQSEATTRSFSKSDVSEIPAGPVSPPLNRTPTSRLKEKTRAGRTSSLKSTLSLNSISLTGSTTTEPRGRIISDEDFNSMIPERDGSNIKTKESNSLPSYYTTDTTTASTAINGTNNSNNNNDEKETNGNENGPSLALKEANIMLARKSQEISNLRKKLDNMNSDMDTTLKNLNNEQVRNTDLEKKLQQLEQEHTLLQIKAANAEKSLREQSKEITNLNQRVREFSDLSSQYKAQVADNKTLRQKLDKLERINTAGPNWKSLYEGLQTQHQRERELWENKLKEMENDLQNMVETNQEAEQKRHIIDDLSVQLQDSEARINQLLCQNDTLQRNNETFKQGYEDEINRLKENIKELEEYIDKTDKSEEDNNKDTQILRLQSQVDEKDKELEELDKMRKVVATQLDQIKSLKEELSSQTLHGSDSDEKPERLAPAKCTTCSNTDIKRSMSRMESMSELAAPLVSDPDQMDHEKLLSCYIDIVNRFNKALAEIKCMKMSVKEAQGATDKMEIQNLQLSQSLKTTENQYQDELKMLTNKIEDLTGKYLSSEKQVRTLKQKVKSTEGRERRRSSIRTDDHHTNREAESALEGIETNLNNMELYMKGKDMEKVSRRKSYETSTKASRARRRSSDNSDISFVERLKKTEKTITDMNRKLSTHGDNSAVFLESIRKQMLNMIIRTREDLNGSNATPPEIYDLLNMLESVVSTCELPVISAEEPGLPMAESISSHLDTIMSFLYRNVDDVYELRKECAQPEISGSKICSVYDISSGLCNGAAIAKMLDAQQATLQVFLLLELQQQLNTVQSRVFAVNRVGQTLRDYNDATRSVLLKVLESKQFVPISSYACKKMNALANIKLTPDTLKAMFKRLKREAQSLFGKIGFISSNLMTVFTDSICAKVSDKDLILEGIKSEVYNMIEEDERMREFQTSLINIFLVCSDCDIGKDPERVNLMANRDEALQSQSEVTRILVDQEIQELSNNLDTKINDDLDSLVLPDSDDCIEKLSQAIFNIASMISQKCVTEAQITILNTLLSMEADNNKTEEEEEEDSDYPEIANLDDYVFNPENMNSECNEFMLVLNNYRQTQAKPSTSSTTLITNYSNNSGSNNNSSGIFKPRLSLSGASGNTLESNLKVIREENKSKKERLSAAISDQREAEDKAVHDLRVWCEKSMTAMEKSYENLLNELQIQHGKEKDSLKREKEQALAEETKATLSALDAMRKAHESEVQKEVEKFKREFLADLKQKECIGALHSGYQEDREEIKREIMSVTSGLLEGWSTSTPTAVDDDSGKASRLTRSPSCPRLYSALSLSTAKSTTCTTTDNSSDEPLKSPLTGMVANRKRVFETEY